jgi:hypothetical protein
MGAVERVCYYPETKEWSLTAWQCEFGSSSFDACEKKKVESECDLPCGGEHEKRFNHGFLSVACREWYRFL